MSGCRAGRLCAACASSSHGQSVRVLHWHQATGPVSATSGWQWQSFVVGRRRLAVAAVAEWYHRRRVASVPTHRFAPLLPRHQLAVATRSFPPSNRLPATRPATPCTRPHARQPCCSLHPPARPPCHSLQWRIMLPDSLPAFRRATASFLDFAASPGAEPFSCAPVSAAERAAARADAAAEGGSGGGDSSGPSGGAPALHLNKGWFGAVAAGAGASVAASGGGSSSQAGGGARAGGYAWQLAERLYSAAQYALAFQLALAPEVGEEELAELGPEWVRPPTLLALQVGC